MVEFSITRKMLSSTPKFPTRSPISTVPYDVLMEIFTHCLPEHPLEILQPDTMTAPMLLCHICSFWRTSALVSPSLWSHLWYCFTIQRTHPALGSWAYRQREIDFVLWWKRNQGSMAPFLRLEFDIEFDPTDSNRDLLARDGMAFVLKYAASAQYLRADSLLWTQIYDKFMIGEQVLFPNLQTLITHGSELQAIVSDYCFYRTQVLIGLVPTRPQSMLRYLAINNDAVETIFPNHWSALTHLSMHGIVISLNFWFSLTGAAPDLQWVYLAFDGIWSNADYIGPPSKYIFPRLSTLFITYEGDREGYSISGMFPFTFLFSALHLPALQTLSLSSVAQSWEDSRAISELYTVLKATPEVTTLSLRKHRFLSLHKASYRTTLAVIGDVAPIWSHAPHLTTLQLELPYMHRPCSDHRRRSEKTLRRVARNIFMSDRSWLALESPACPLQTITLMSPMRPGSDFDYMKDFMMSCILNHREAASNVAFKIVSDPEGDDGAEAWKEWGAKDY